MRTKRLNNAGISQFQIEATGKKIQFCDHIFRESIFLTTTCFRSKSDAFILPEDGSYAKQNISVDFYFKLEDSGKLEGTVELD